MVKLVIMLTINKKSLPKFLQTSELIKQFDDEEVTIPKKYMINNLKITNNEECYTIIDKLRFFMVNEIPHEVFDYVHTSDKFDVTVFNHLEDCDIVYQLQLLGDLNIHINKFNNVNYDNFVQQLFDEKYMNLLNYAIKNGLQVEQNYCLHCTNDYDLLKFCHEHDAIIDMSVFNTALLSFNKKCIDYCIKHGSAKYELSLEEKWDEYDRRLYKPISYLLKIRDSKNKQFKVFEDTIKQIITNDNVKALKYIFENFDLSDNQSDNQLNKYKESTFKLFILNCFRNLGPTKPKMKCLEYIIFEGCKILGIDYTTINKGWIYEHLIIKPQLTDDYLIRVLEKAYNLSETKSINEHISKNIMIMGRLKVVKYLHKVGCKFSTNICDTAVQCQNAECFYYLHSVGYPLSAVTFINAMTRGDVERIIYCCDNNCSTNLLKNMHKCGTYQRHFDILAEKGVNIG